MILPIRTVALPATISLFLLAVSACSPPPAPPEDVSDATLVESVPAAEGERKEESSFSVGFEMAETYVPGEPVVAGAVMEYTGEGRVTALALRVAAPEGWQYAGVSGALRPAIEPPAGARGELVFVWIKVPAFPATFEFMLDTPGVADGPAGLAAQAVYRELGGELRSPEATIELTPKS